MSKYGSLLDEKDKAQLVCASDEIKVHTQEVYIYKMIIVE